MAKTRKEKERAQKLWEERRELLRFGYGKIAEFIVREARQKYQQAMQARLKGDLQTAEAMLREIVEKVPNAPDPLLALGQLLLETGRAEEAIGFLSKACEVDDMNPQSHFLFGQALEAVGRLRRAKEAYERALQRYPTGDLAKEIARKLQALEERLASQSSPDLSEEQAKALEEALHWAKFYLEVGFPRRAREYLEQAKTIAPDHPVVQEVSKAIEQALST
ncbi:tetratricopeptide repeat protein [Fervidibacter sacchari]|uniref:Tetratricopeptide (TPR) repeat protein n=1 Tax=Candidatus Fervidibacter sacchari TaxID=1448929 RepID=A0ABT2EPX3_9BACT|nr:tetratricopeptide repeat protein [Candidatus Fervidibacter sacchari]MCS3919971.1 tetratricopeptide (TPR) repeat protein [Candidatus Fervidibacter sacchari]WKU16794.1 tetratricopeptide repeat protein [Candidatus Fervidibacter sacchari]